TTPAGGAGIRTFSRAGAPRHAGFAPPRARPPTAARTAVKAAVVVAAHKSVLLSARLFHTSCHKHSGPPRRVARLVRMSGGVLLSHAVSRAVPSALKGLASGFGMEPGVSPSPWPPKRYGDMSFQACCASRLPY